MKDRCKCGAWSALDHDACPKCGTAIPDQTSPSKAATFPREAWIIERITYSHEQWARPIFVWGELNGWCLISPNGFGETKVISRNVIHYEKPDL